LSLTSLQFRTCSSLRPLRDLTTHARNGESFIRQHVDISLPFLNHICLHSGVVVSTNSTLAMDFQHPSRISHSHGSESLSPLPSDLRKGLYALTTLGFISFFSCVVLQALLTWRIIQWAMRGKRPNQCFILIFNLILADIQQSIAFLLNSSWLAQDGIMAGTSNCWAQGWYVNYSLT